MSMSKKEKTELTKEELMKQVLGKRRSMGDPLDELRSRTEEVSRRIDRMISEEKSDRRHEEQDLMRTLLHNQRTLEELSSEVDLGDLKEQIAKDFGVSSGLGYEPAQTPVSKRSSPVEWRDVAVESVPAMMRELVDELSGDVLGQEDAIADMAEAIFRPYVHAPERGALRNKVYISGPRGTGRHFIFKRMLRAVEGKLIDSADYVTLDMADYQEPSKESVFLQDLYSALTGTAPFLVIERFELAHVGINNMLGELISDGRVRLSKRYTEKNGVLQESEKTLQTEYLREMRGNGKFLVMISDQKKSAVVNTYGKTVADAFLDQVGTKSFEPETVRTIVERSVDDFLENLRKVTRAKVDMDEASVDALMSGYEPVGGVHGILQALDGLKAKIYDLSVSRLGKDLSIRYREGYQAVYRDETVSLMSIDQELARVRQEIAEVVGLDAVKDYLFSMEDLVKAGSTRRRLGLKSDAVTRHMIFTGNPGTGKTTIARLVSRLMKAIGALDQGHLVEVSRADLVGRYVGHTAPLTMSVIKSALGGVLFIDEAYSLYRGKDDSFGLEAIDTLVKGMEDNRDNLMVILAGYSDEMEVFLTANSGLKSRFPKTVHFKDYTADELLQIALAIAKSKDYIIDPGVREPLQRYLGERNREERSNGRLARNVVEAAIIKQSGRLRETDDERSLRTLLPEDFDLQESI